MTELLIKTDTEFVRDALSMFLKTYKEQIAEYINLELRDKGQLVDSGFVIGDDGQITVCQVAEDKGFVLANTDEFPYWEMKKSKNVGEDEVFIRMTKQGLTLFIKSEYGIPDVKVGEFKTFDDAVVEYNSESVAKALASARASKKEQLKQIKKLLKLGKLGKPEEAQEEVVAPAVADTEPVADSRPETEQPKMEVNRD